MTKSFKKVIACLLAVLMTVFSFPFSALANGGDYTADVRLQFSPVYTRGYFDYAECLAADSLFDYTMLQEAPLTYTYTMTDDHTVSGSLKLEAAKTKPICDDLGVDPLDDDTELGVGDYFAVTVVIDGVDYLFAAQEVIQYSENIEPAGTYSVTKSRKQYQGLAGISDGKSITVGGVAAVDSNSAAGLYDGADDGLIGNVSKIDADNRLIYSSSTVQNGSKMLDVSAVTNDEVAFTNPETGALGYEYTGRFIANTFIFKIVDDGDIAFSVYDTDNTKVGAFGGFYFLDDGRDPSNDNYTTYAVNGDNAGSTKMTFYGKNANVAGGDEDCTHANTSTVGAKAATCTEDGYTGDVVCSDCDEVITPGSVIPATGHSYTSAVTTQPTCTTAGVTTYTCACGDSYTEAQPPAKGHTLVDDAAVAVTCTTAGKEAGKHCTACDYKEGGTTIAPLGHDIVADEAVAPTCTEDGLTAGEHCSRCDYAVAQEVDPALGHDIVADEAVAPTCTEDGLTAGEHCSRCDYAVAQEVDPAKGHSYGEWVTVTEPTEETEGSAKRECANCDAFDTKTLPALDHTHVYTAVVTDPTCTEQGYTTYTCKCGDSYVDDYEVALGHDIVVDEAVAPTCTEDGLTAGEHCSRCDYAVEQEVDPALGHDIVADEAVAPTCTEAGLTAGEHCSRCDYAVAQEVDPAKGHTLVDDAAVEATCTEAGLTAGKHCTACDYVEAQEVVPAKGHKAAADKVGVKAATIDEAGYTGDVVCSACSEVMEAGSVIPMLASVKVTIDNTYADLGSVAGLDYGTTKVKKDSVVTLTATPVEGGEFFGWEIDGKIAAETATYKFTAYKDVTITPVFVNPNAELITVVFYDCYKNVVANYANATVADFQAAMATKIPAGSNFAGKTFAGWSMNDEAIKALDKSMTIEAVYTDAVNDGYTVTTVAPATFADGTTEMTGVKYDTQVTVTAPGATAWEINGVEVAYGDTYTFYVGSDVEVTPVFTAVTAKPAVAVVSVDGVEGSHKVAFLATKTVVDGYTIVDHGFVYGKAATAAELKLENVGKTIAASGTTIKSASISSASDQFALNYGITSKVGTATAVAYITYKDAAGTITTDYSELMSYTY